MAAAPPPATADADVAALAKSLPDHVKRLIGLLALEDDSQQSSSTAPAPASATAAAPSPPHTHTDDQTAAAAAIAARTPLLRLPDMQGGACILDGCLTQGEVQAAAAALEAHLSCHGRQAGMGSSGAGGWHADASVRGDTNCWATPQELQAAGQPLLAAVLQLLASLRSSLVDQGWDVAGRCSCQLVCYPGGGARYVRHADASESAPERSITALLYLNPPDWDSQTDGGQLALYNAAHHHSAASSSSSSSEPPAAGYLGGEPALVVSAVGGRLLVFDSRLQHEVLPAHRRRYSITAFFYKGRQQQQLQTPHAMLPSNVAAAAAAADSPVASQQQAAPATINSSATVSRLPRIFVSVAAFRDDECQWTLRDLFVKAAHPARVFVGVVWQVNPAADADFVRMAGGARTAAHAHQVREVRLHYSTATGPCAARSLAQQLWAGEEFVLQVDAHMRFVQDWDELCLAQLAAAQQAAGSTKVVLSTYPAGYSGHGAAAAVPEDVPPTLLCAQGFDEAGMLHVVSRCLRERPPRPLRSHFWAAGFSFAPCGWLLEVPYCPHLPHLFFGEEQFMLLRMATRGWQVWAPSCALAFHQWERSARANSFQACIKVDAAARAASQARVLQLGSCQKAEHADTAAQPAEPGGAAGHAAQPPSEADWAVGGIWGLGMAVPLQEVEAAAGVGFSSRAVQPRALCGGQPTDAFVEALAVRAHARCGGGAHDAALSWQRH